MKLFFNLLAVKLVTYALTCIGYFFDSYDGTSFAITSGDIVIIAWYIDCR